MFAGPDNICILHPVAMSPSKPNSQSQHHLLPPASECCSQCESKEREEGNTQVQDVRPDFHHWVISTFSFILCKLQEIFYFRVDARVTELR